MGAIDMSCTNHRTIRHLEMNRATLSIRLGTLFAPGAVAAELRGPGDPKRLGPFRVSMTSKRLNSPMNSSSVSSRSTMVVRRLVLDRVSAERFLSMTRPLLGAECEVRFVRKYGDRRSDTRLVEHHRALTDFSLSRMYSLNSPALNSSLCKQLTSRTRRKAGKQRCQRDAY